MRARLALFAVTCGALFCASNALAQAAPPSGPEPTGEDDTPDREGRPKAYAPDGRSGHVTIAAVAAAEFPAGDIAPGRALTEVVDVGFSVGGSIAIGLSRHVSLDAIGRYGQLYPNGDCDSCTASLATASLGIQYHVAQGSSFDPWGRLGVGYRTFAIDHDENETERVLAVANGRYHGLDAAQLAVGGWFFPAPGFGLGPFIEADIGTFLNWADGSPAGTRAYAFFQIGLALAIDPVEWASPTPAAAPDPPKNALLDVSAPRF